MKRALLLGTIGAVVVLLWSLGGCKKDSGDEGAVQAPPKKQTEQAEQKPAPAPALQNDVVAVPEGWDVAPDNDKAPGEAGYRIKHADSGIEMVYVPAGKFMMGAEGGLADESPVREVELGAYWIGLSEVTRAQWLKVMTGADDAGDDTPVSDISWDEARAFCEKIGMRLPTEAEWEFAARGPEGHVYPWGDEWDATKCCNAGNKGEDGGVSAAGSFPDGASWCGALDMAGNVAEWCGDYYSAGARASAARVNPTGPAACSAKSYRVHTIGTRALPMDKAHVVRGGSWFDKEEGCFRSAQRSFVPDYQQQRYFSGFRCASGLADKAEARTVVVEEASA